MNDLEELRQFLKSLPVLSDKDRGKRVKRARKSFRYFVQTYVAHHINNTQKETSKFRNFIYDEFPVLEEVKNKFLFEAYRGAAKTTMITRLFTMWKMLKEKKYGVLIGSTTDLAKESLEMIQTEFEDNQRLIADFDIRKGDTWTSEEIVFSIKGTLKKIKVFGSGKKMRGINFLSSRPDLIVCDDIENDENVESSTQRDKLYNWFKKAVLKLVSRSNATYTIVVQGTRLHHDSLLVRIEARGDFEYRNFKLVLEFPHRLDEITKENLSLELIEGIKLDDSAIDPLEVMRDFLIDRDSFYSEYQNEPLSKDGLIFSNYTTFTHFPLCDIYVIGADPALGKKKGDLFGLSLIGALLKEKKFYWQGWGYKIPATKMIDLIISLYIRIAAFGKPLRLAIEITQFQEFFKDTLKQKARSMGIIISVDEVKSTTIKELRIDSLAPDVNDGTMLICEDSHLLIEELNTYPKAAHDDILDSGEMAYKSIKRSMRLDYKAVAAAQRETKKYLKSDNYA
jgi:predicted phage terminase large subunit-like protein